jgi:mannose-6-phosphate isomerase-like protein (cupin superfamily)
MSNINRETAGIELLGSERFVHLDSDQGAIFRQEPPEYWENPSERPSLRNGRILSVFEYDSTWSHWERHPVGDEFALVITGEVDLLLDQPSGTDTIRLCASQCGVIPQGAWHTLRIVRQSRLLFVTPTPALTEHRTF